MLLIITISKGDINSIQTSDGFCFCTAKPLSQIFYLLGVNIRNSLENNP